MSVHIITSGWNKPNDTGLFTYWFHLHFSYQRELDIYTTLSLPWSGTWHIHSNAEHVQGMTHRSRKLTHFASGKKKLLNCLIFPIIEHILSILIIHTFFYRCKIRK